MDLTKDPATAAVTRARRTIHTFVMLPLLTLLLLGGCVNPPSIPVATDAVFPPFHFVGDDGRLTGYDIETIRAALERVGAKADVRRGESFRALFDGLEDGAHDIVAATTGITEERQRRFAFTRPYFTTCLGVMIRNGPTAPRSVAGLAGRRVAASEGTTSEAAAQRLAGVTVVPMRGAQAMLDALRAGDVDAVVIDEFEAVEFSRDDDRLGVLAEPASLERYGFMLRHEDDDLLANLDFALASMERDGTLARLQTRFGLDRSDDWPIRMSD